MYNLHFWKRSEQEKNLIGKTDDIDQSMETRLEVGGQLLFKITQ